MTTTAMAPTHGACTHVGARERRLRTLETLILRRVHDMPFRTGVRDHMWARYDRVFDAIVDEMRKTPCRCEPRGRTGAPVSSQAGLASVRVRLGGPA